MVFLTVHVCSLGVERRAFLARCMSTVERATRQKKWQACGRCLMVIDKLLTLSEALGRPQLDPVWFFNSDHRDATVLDWAVPGCSVTAGSGSARPHSSRGRGKPVNLIISNNIPTGPKKFDVKAYANSTLWEVRVAVAKHCKVTPDRVRMYRGSEVHACRRVAARLLRTCPRGPDCVSHCCGLIPRGFDGCVHPRFLVPAHLSPCFCLCSCRTV